MLLLFLLVLSAFFSSAETSLTTVNKIKIKTLADSGDKRAKRVLRITENPSKMISAILIGNNIANLSSSALTTTIAIDLFGSTMVGVATGVLTIAIIMLCEIIPKKMATKHALGISLVYAMPIEILMKALTPIIFIIDKLTSFIKSEETSMTEEDLKTIVAMSQEEGAIEPEEHKMIDNILSLDDKTAKEVMIPAQKIVGIDVNFTYDDIMKTFHEEQYTRIVVFKDENNVAGIINVKDFLFVDKESFDINDVMRDAYITYENKTLSDLLPDMKKTANNMAVIVNEYGIITGLLTIEDILEELVGEIQDEYDESDEISIKKISNDEYLISGDTKIMDINRRLNTKLQTESYNSIGGLIIEKLQRIPVVQDSINLGKMTITVIEMEEAHIKQVKLQLKAA